ncbi:SAM-dependent methyltransferase [Frankia nepalensis]|uniref:SAM-dependent methyltransferase n=1 Tax=Frankia nepalensis TaxID=1836974 RepID=UPI0027DB7B98|nr:SAM-dependent methyltransferase [Frankia nepalensis]
MCNQGLAPVVQAHARTRLTSSPQGRMAYIPAHLHYPPSILASPDLTETLKRQRIRTDCLQTLTTANAAPNARPRPDAAATSSEPTR